MSNMFFFISEEGLGNRQQLASHAIPHCGGHKDQRFTFPTGPANIAFSYRAQARQSLSSVSPSSRSRPDPKRSKSNDGGLIHRYHFEDEPGGMDFLRFASFPFRYSAPQINLHGNDIVSKLRDPTLFLHLKVVACNDPLSTVITFSTWTQAELVKNSFGKRLHGKTCRGPKLHAPH